MPRVRAIWARGVPASLGSSSGDGVTAEAGAAGGAGDGYPGGGAFGSDGAFELCDGAEDVEDKSAAWGGGVHWFGERTQLEAAAALQVLGDGEQVGQGAAEAVQPAHHVRTSPRRA
ncbi:hypothetical protein AO501_07970 [Mycobacterium gordonae]|uniref:Uncharacterized protein n=1 Tax=Mycobacterium gordonae TaxID=1778 RepID=A0A0Q2XCW6_MYCGO|nr:hypothetical protein AO501_07970 [Mycobacterium gordonae]